MKTRNNSSIPTDETLENSLRRLLPLLFFLFAAQSNAQTMNAERASQFLSHDAKRSSQEQKVVTAQKPDQRNPSAVVPVPETITIASYPFSSSAGTALEDMSSGTTQLLGPGLDDNSSAITSIGFDFWFDGIRQTQFSVNANGLFGLGGTVVNNGSTGRTNDFATATNNPKISPYWDDMCTAATGKVHYKVVGAAPNRKLVVEWLNLVQFNNGTSTCGTSIRGTYQLWLFESTGVIQLVHGGMATNDNGAGGYSVGIGTSSTSFASVTTTANTVSYAASNNAQTNSIPTGTAYIFTPPVPAAPTGLSFTATTAISMTLNWTDNTNNEVGYVIYNSTDGTNFTFVTQTAANATSQNFSGLTPSTNYFWRVFAVTEGRLSTALAGSHATSALGNITSTAGSGNWSSPATWVGGVIPSATDNVTIADTSTVTIDTAGVAYNVTVGQGGGGELKFETTTPRSLTVTNDVTVAGNGTFSTEVNVASTVTTHLLSVGHNLTANGTLDFATNPGFAGTNAGASILFTGVSNATFSGPGAFNTDVRAITVNKGNSPASVLELNFPNNFRVLGVMTDAGGFLTLTNGTFKLSGNFTMTNRVFTTAAYTIPATTAFWLNNPNFTVAGQNGSATTNGLLRVSQGTYNIGTSTGNSMGFATGADIMIEGGVINASGRFGVAAAGNTITYNQAGGTITVCTVGNTSTTLASFDLGTALGSTINMTGGIISVQLANTIGSGPRDYRNQAGAGTDAVTGGTLQLGNGFSGAAKAFNIAGIVPDLVITNTSANHSATFLPPSVFNNLTRNITINTGTTLNTGNNVFLMNGTTLTNNGTLTANGASSNFIWFLTTAPVTYTGSGVVTAPMTNFIIQADMGLTINPASANIVVGAIRLLSGSLTNSNKITLGNGGATTGVVQIGNTTTPTAAGNFDVPFTFNLGTGGETLSYLRTTNARSTGPEVTPTRNVTSLTYDDNDASHTLTIAGGDLSCVSSATALNLTNGRIITGPNTLILPNSTSSVSRTAGFVDGNLRKNFAAAANKTFEVGTVNGYSPVGVNVTAGTFPATFTVKATNGPLPAFPNLAAALQRYWTLTAANLTADLTFNYVDPIDIPVTANESNFVIHKYDGALTQPGGSVNTAANTASIAGVTSFSDWTLAAPAPVVVNVNDTGAGSLRQAVSDATTGDTITFNLGAGTHNINLASEVVISKNLTIEGPTNGSLALNGQSSHRIFNIGAGAIVTLSNLNLLNGSDVASGGGIANNGDLRIFNCALAGNVSSAANGGAIYNGGTAKITNTTLSQNFATNGNGGAIFNNAGANLTLGNCTVAQNSASGNGGGIQNLGTLNLKNSIIALNTATLGRNVFSSGGGASSSGYNMSNDDGGGFLNAVGDQVNTDPILGPLKNNGGLTYTHAPLSNSPAIDTGKDLGADGLATGRDQRGGARPVTYLGSITPPPGGDRSDIGAVELAVGVIPATAASVKSHGGTPFSIPLTLSGPAAVECRSTGGSNDYQVVLTFAGPVTFSTANFTSGTGSVGSTSNVGNQVTLNLTGVTNLQTITMALFDTNDGAHSGDVGVRMGMLIGDASGNGTVNSTDVSQTKLRSGQAATAANFRSDVNASGTVNSTDVSTVKLRSGTSLP
jgi:hypothetical protein